MARAFNPSGTFRIPVFDGGWNTKWTDINCPEHMSPDLQNVQYDEVGAAGTARGYFTFNAATLGSAPVDGLADFYNNTTEYLVAVCSSLVHSCASTGGTFSVVSGGTNVFSAGFDADIAVVEDEAFITNGRTAPHRFDGTNLHTVGVSAFSGSLATGALASAGSIDTGTYWYGIAGLNANGVESNVATLTTGISTTSGNEKIVLTGIGDFPSSAGVETKYLYRTTAGASTLFYRVTALTAAQSAYTDSAHDSDLETLAQTTNNTPPPCKYWVYHRGRMFAAGDPNYPQRVWFSSAGQPEIWPLANALDIGKGDGYPITGLRIMANSVIVHKASPSGRESSIWLIYMPDSVESVDSSNWYIIKSPAAYGSMSHKGMAFFDNLLMYVSRTGAYAWSGENVAPGPAASEAGQYLAQSRSENIDPTWAQLNSQYFQKAAMVDFDNKLFIAISDDEQYNDKLLTYDYSTISKERTYGSWSILSAPKVNCFAIFDGKLMGGDATNGGDIFQLDSTWSHDGAAIDSYFRTIRLGGKKEHWEYTKVFRFAWLTVDLPGNWDMTVEWWVDQEVYGNSETINLNPGGALWDEAMWDEDDLWDSSQTRKTVRINLAGVVGQTIQFRFSTNTAEQYFNCYRMELEYRLRGRRD